MIGQETFSNGVSVRYAFTPDAKKAGHYIIHVRFTIYQQQIRLKETEVSTGVKCDPKKWGAEKVKGIDITAELKNKRLDEIKTIMKETFFEMKKLDIKSPAILLKEINVVLKPKINTETTKAQKEVYLSRLVQHKVDVVKDSYLSSRKVSKAYKRWFKTTCERLTNYYGHTPTVGEITKQDLESFKIYLEDHWEYMHNSVVTTLNRLRTILLHAVDKELIPKSPMPRGFVAGYVQGTREILTAEEMQAIVDVPDKGLTTIQRRAKYIFLFMAATALGHGELKALRDEYIKKVDQHLHLKKRRVKTNEEFEVTFSPLARQAFDRMMYLGITFEELPTIDAVNRALVDLMRMAGISKHITSYCGRHTFATQWLANGNDINTLKNIMGHTDVRTTQIYESLLPEKMIQTQNIAYAKTAMHNIQIT